MPDRERRRVSFERLNEVQFNSWTECTMHPSGEWLAKNLGR